MIRAGVGLSAGSDGPAAVEQAASAALAGASGADLAILFATPAYPEGVAPLLAAAVDVLGTSAVVGASAHGVLGAGIECENQASVSILALTGIEAERGIDVSKLWQANDTEPQLPKFLRGCLRYCTIHLA